MKKRNPWSDDESKSESDLEETEPVVIPRDSLLREQPLKDLNTHLISQKKRMMMLMMMMMTIMI